MNRLQADRVGTPNQKPEKPMFRLFKLFAFYKIIRRFMGRR